jgi:hypothetical protein
LRKEGRKQAWASRKEGKSIKEGMKEDIMMEERVLRKKGRALGKGEKGVREGRKDIRKQGRK